MVRRGGKRGGENAKNSQKKNASWRELRLRKVTREKEERYSLYSGKLKEKEINIRELPRKRKAGISKLAEQCEERARRQKGEETKGSTAILKDRAS